MTYNVFSGMLNPTQLIDRVAGKLLHAGRAAVFVLLVSLLLTVWNGLSTTEVQSLSGSGIVQRHQDKCGSRRILVDWPSKNEFLLAAPKKVEASEKCRLQVKWLHIFPSEIVSFSFPLALWWLTNAIQK